MKKKTVNIIVNVIVGVIFVLVLLITINIIASRGKGYTSIFGTAAVAVKSDSMEGEGENCFNKGDLLFVKILKDEEDKKTLKAGDVISFYDVNKNGELNTHRIVFVAEDSDGIRFQTRGDNTTLPDVPLVTIENVVGVYNGSKIGGIGSVFLFFNTTTGFLVCVVLPAILLVAYCVYEVIRSVMEHNRAAAVGDKEALRAQILAEMEAEKKSEDENNSDEEQK